MAAMAAIFKTYIELLFKNRKAILVAILKSVLNVFSWTERPSDSKLDREYRD